MSILKYDNVEWALPFLFGYDIELISIVKLLKDLETPFKFNSFGTLKSKWSGGRISVVKHQDAGFVKRLFSHLVNIGVTPSLTFTNHNISKEDLNDPFCNYILDLAQDLNCNLILSSDLLFDYIKNKYPSAKCTASVIKPIFEFQTPSKIKSYDCEEEINFYNNLLEKYDKVVLRPEFVKYHFKKNHPKIKNIPKIEILVNQICAVNCPLAIEHYKHIENVETNKNKERYFNCYLNKINLSPQEALFPNLFLNREEMNDLVYNIGVKHLKMQGRAGAQNRFVPLLTFYDYVLDIDYNSSTFQHLVESIRKQKINKFFQSEILRISSKIHAS